MGRGDSQPEAVNLRRALAQRSMPPRHALDVLTAFRMDVTKLRYENWDEVIHYCRYSAMPVGRFMLDVHGESTSTWAASDALMRRSANQQPPSGLRRRLQSSQSRLSSP
jgi:phytoene/squalene synthetase